jgi:hypothetical protein
MTATEIFNIMVAAGTATRDEIDEFFALLSTDTLENQIAMTLTPNGNGTIYTTVDGNTIEVTE